MGILSQDLDTTDTHCYMIQTELISTDFDIKYDGQHETLINELSKLSQFRPLRVISGSTVNAFRNYDKPAFEIAREIDVECLVDSCTYRYVCSPGYER